MDQVKSPHINPFADPNDTLVTGWPTSARIMLWLLVLLGCLLLLRNVLQPISLFLDETYLLFNIVEKDIPAYAGELDHYQIAPMGFMVAVRAAIEAFGLSERSARLVPVLAAMLALPLLAVIVRRLYQPVVGLVVVLALAVSPEWLLQSCRVKPYSMDLLFCLLGIWVGLWLLERRCGVKETLLASAVAAVGMWCSIPFYMVLPGVGLALLASRLTPAGRPERRGDLPGLLVVAAVGLVAGAVHYFWVLRNQQHAGDTAEHMDAFWESGFVPIPLLSPYGFVHRMQELAGDATYLALPGLVLGLAALGLVFGLKRRDPRVWIVVMPLAVSVIASMAKVYPLSDRLALFLAPVFLILLAWGLTALHRAIGGPLGAGLVLVTLAVLLTRPMVDRGQAPFTDDVVPVLQHVNQHLKPDQNVYLYYGALNPYDFYRIHLDPELGFDPRRTIRGNNHREDWTGYEQEIQQLQDAGREVWLVMSHVARGWHIHEGHYFTMLLNQHGTILQTHQEWSAYAILWKPDPPDTPPPDVVQKRTPDNVTP